MASTIKIKRSSVPGKTPNTSNIGTGELALNLADNRLFSSNGTAVFEIGSITANGVYNSGTSSIDFTRKDSTTFSVDVSALAAGAGGSFDLTTITANTTATSSDSGKNYVIDATGINITVANTNTLSQGFQFVVYNKGIQTTVSLPSGSLFTNRGILPDSVIADFSDEQLAEYQASLLTGGSSSETLQNTVDKAVVTYHGSDIFTIVETTNPSKINLNNLFKNVTFADSNLTFTRYDGTTSNIDLSSFNVDLSGYLQVANTTNFATSDDLSAYLQVANTTNFATSDQLSAYIQVANTVNFATTSYVDSAVANTGGGDAITDGTKTLDFSANNNLQVDTNFYPTANGTYDLGSSTNRWQNVYTSDLHLNNGIGDYTVVEGEEDLFLYNNKSGKVFKFALIEVDPSEATPKISELKDK